MRSNAIKIVSRVCLAAAILGLTFTSARAQEADMPAARRAAAAKPRPLIFNNDGGELTGSLQAPTAEEILKYRTLPLKDTPVSTVFFCPRSSPFGTFTYPTKIGDVFTAAEGHYATNIMAQVLKANIDPFMVINNFLHEHKKELFFSMRMNDTHDIEPKRYGPIMLRNSRLKTQHPDWLLGTKEKPTKYGGWTGVDYARPEIRDLALSYFTEICQNYPVDGIELDFFRHMMFFKNPSRGLPATTEELAAMTDLVRRIRKMADAEGAKRGRPILIAMRLPDSIEYAKAVGLDMETWLQEGLLDILVTTSYIQLNPWEYSVALGHKYGVKVYPSLDDSRVPDAAALAVRQSDSAYRARAAAAWAQGVDGIYLFNYFEMNTNLYQELDDPKKLITLDKDYFASYRGVGTNLTYPPQPFQRLATLNPSSPLALKPGKKTSVDIYLGEDFAAAQSQGKTPRITLRLRLPEITDPGQVTVLCNDRPMTQGKVVNGDPLLQNRDFPIKNGTSLVSPDRWVEFELQPDQLKSIRNTITLTPAVGSPVKTWSDLNIRIRYK